MVVPGPQPPLQTFCWGDPLAKEVTPSGEVTHYHSFTLNGQHYTQGDVVYLYPEDASQPPFIARLTAAFSDSRNATDPHCIEVRWFERRVNLEPMQSATPTEELQHELLELDGTVDTNPIGSIVKKCIVIQSRSWAEALKSAKSLPATEEWFFCRGVYRQDTNTFTMYSDLPGGEQQQVTRNKRDAEQVLEATRSPLSADKLSCKRAKCDPKGDDADVDDGDKRAGVGKPGKQCVECGAQSTPQWREGPQGPKTLCNACGVRYVRAQQRANKRAAQQHQPRAASVAVPPVQTKAKVRGNGKVVEQGHAAGAVMSAAMAPEVPSSGVHSAPEGMTHGMRPVRQAALAAATKTAAFARTGVFPSSHEEARGLTASAATAAYAAGAGAAAYPSSNDNSSHNSSDSAEEVGYEPATAAAAAAAAITAAAAAAAPVLRAAPEAAGVGTRSALEPPGRVSATAVGAAAAGPRMGPPGPSSILHLGTNKEQQQQHPHPHQQHPQQLSCSLPCSLAEQQQHHHPNHPAPQQQPDQRMRLMKHQRQVEDGSSGSDDVDAEEGGPGALLEHAMHQSMDDMLKAEGMDSVIKQESSPGAVLCGQPSHQLGGRDQLASRMLHQQQPEPSRISALDVPTANDLRNLAGRAATYFPDAVAGFTELFGNYDVMRSQLPRDELSKLQSISAAVEFATSEAASADAALEAVNQVLMKHQEAANRARAHAVRTIESMKSYMSELLSRYTPSMEYNLQPSVGMWDNSALLHTDLDGAAAETTLIQLDMGPELITVQE